MNRISHYIVPTALGFAAFAFETAPTFQLKEVLLPKPDRKTVKDLILARGWKSGTRHPEADRLAEMISTYFHGEKIKWPWSWLDLCRWTPAQENVYRAVAAIAYGEVRSYGDVAQRAGHPRAARFVGNCMANNPFPVLIPCHRVIRNDGRLGGFGGGSELKRKMLHLEGLSV